MQMPSNYAFFRRHSSLVPTTSFTIQCSTHSVAEKFKAGMRKLQPTSHIRPVDAV